MKIAMIVAMDEDGFVGKDGEIPWRLASDMRRFRNHTKGDGFNSVIMGRRTWESLPESQRPLRDRVNIVMSKDTNWTAEGAETALYVGRAIELAFAEGSEECWIIGGTQIYEMFFDRVEEIHVTIVHTTNSGDLKFPKWNKEEWVEEIMNNVPADEENIFPTTYSVWRKRQ